MTEKCRALDQGLPDIVRTPYSQIISDLAKDRDKQEDKNRLVAPNAQVGRLIGHHGLTPHSSVCHVAWPNVGL
jgi:hypothetical protein